MIKVFHTPSYIEIFREEKLCKPRTPLRKQQLLFKIIIISTTSLLKAINYCHRPIFILILTKSLTYDFQDLFRP